MSTRTEALLNRLSAIGSSLEASGKALALIGLGSVGLERHRLDEYSDLDFFAIVRDGEKKRFIEDLGWLSSIHPIAFAFQNTPDGYKVLYQDDIFLEFAVFEPSELAGIPFAPGVTVWSANDFDPRLAVPADVQRGALDSSVEWQLGEALTNLYVGLMRDWRGEHLSAQRFIQHFAVDRVLELVKLTRQPARSDGDRFMTSRRFEGQYPDFAAHLPAFIGGYSQNRESARAVLEWLDANFDVNPFIKARILDLCRPE